MSREKSKDEGEIFGRALSGGKSRWMESWKGEERSRDLSNERTRDGKGSAIEEGLTYAVGTTGNPGKQLLVKYIIEFTFIKYSV